jgi:hypothetical protein
MTIGVVAAIVIAILVNTGIAVGTSALDPNGTKIGLMLVAYGPLTAIGVLAGTVGWAAIRRRAAHPRAVLRRLVPTVVGVSLIPGIVLLIVGETPVNVVGLWVMHLVVAIVTVTTLGWVLPLRDNST